MIKVLNVEKIKEFGGQIIPDKGELIVHFPNFSGFSGVLLLVHKNREYVLSLLASAEFIASETITGFSKLQHDNYEAFHIKMLGCGEDTKNLLKSWED